jgi:UDP-galactopyranose mutase
MSLPTIYIIGAGLSGATLARLLANHGHNVVVYEQANHIGGNCYDYFNKHGILVQKYGPHIFHTDKKHVYEFVKRFTKFNDKHINVLVNINDKLTDMPINFRSIDLFFAQNADIIKKYIFKQ